MKRIKNNLISIFIVMILVLLNSFLPVSAVTTYTYGAYTYADIDDTNVALYGYDNSSSTLVIPAEFNGKYVNSIYDYAFENNSFIDKLDFSAASKKLRTIGVNSFAGCTGLTGVLSLPSSVTKMGASAFYGCSGINTVKINSNVKTIPRECFNRCSSLETVYVSNQTTTIDNLAFANCTNLKDVYLPSNINEINSNAFLNSGSFTIHCKFDSYAYHYAKDNGIKYELSEPYYGDANSDEVINILDVTAIQRYKIGEQELSEYGMRCADVNHDGSITVRDATLIQMKLAKYDVDF